MALFTPETAAQMAARSHEAQRKAKEQRALILAGPPQVTVELVKDGISQRLERTRKQIELLDELIDNSSDPDELDAYTRSKERLFRIWAHLAGIPGPGNLKPSSRPQQTRPRMVEPLDVAPQDTTDGVQSATGQPDSPKS